MFELSIAARHITSRHRQTLLSLTAVAMAVSISMVFVSLTNGQQQLVLDIYIGVIPHVDVRPQANEDYLHLYNTAQEKVWSIKGVRSVSTRLYARASFSHKDRVKNSLMMGVPPDGETEISKVGEKMAQGDLPSILGGRNIVLGAELADRLKAKLGDVIGVSFPQAKSMHLTVTGIIDTGTDYDEYAYVSSQTAQEFLQEGDVVSVIVIALQDPYQAQSVSNRISDLGYETRSWQEDEPDAQRILDVIGFWRMVVIFLALAVSSFGIANIMNLLVVEKTREIGMLMAIGASRSNIAGIFLFECAILGLAGAALGIVIGLAAVRAIGSISFQVPGAAQVTHLALLIHPWDVLTIALLAVILTIAAGVYPGIRASQLDPVQALRG